MLSCKGRGVCPSCNAKRAHVTTAHLVERVLPHVLYRQWTLSFPHRVRWVLLKFHSLVPDGVFVPREGGVCFEALPPSTQDEVERLLRGVHLRVLRLLGWNSYDVWRPWCLRLGQTSRGLGVEADAATASQES